MSFIDPFELLQLDVKPGQVLGPEEVRRAKRKLLAEFELADGITIQYRGQEMDKAAALAAVEQLEDPATQARLIQLHNKPDLLKVLRDRDLRSLLLLPVAEKLGDRDFLKYLSGILAPEFNEILGKQVRSADWASAGRVLGKMDLIDEWDHGTALKSLVNHTRLQLQRINEVTANTAISGDWNEKAAYASGFMTTLNRLPKEFQHLRNQYGTALEKLAIALAEQHERNQLAHEVVTAAASLSMDPNTADRIRRNQLWLWGRLRAAKTAESDQAKGAGSSQGQASRESEPKSGSSTSSNTGCTLGIVVVVIIVLLRVAFSSGSDSHKGPDFRFYKPPVITVPEFPLTETKMLDSRALSGTKKLDSTLEALRASNRRSLANSHVDIAAPRYDTIFFRDLMFYEGLDAARKTNPDAMGELLDPANGTHLYENAIPKLSHPYDKPQDKVQPLRLSNDSDHDCIFFFETFSGGQIIRSYFLKAHSSHLVTQLGASFYNVRAYHGLQLRAAAARYRGIQVPAFTMDASALNGKNDVDKLDQPLVEMVFNFAHIDFETNEPIIKNIHLRGDFWLKEIER